MIDWQQKNLSACADMPARLLKEGVFMHEPFFLRGTLLYSSSPDTIEILDDGWLLCRNGKAAGVFRQKPERFKNLDVLDYSGKLIIPAASAWIWSFSTG